MTDLETEEDIIVQKEVPHLEADISVLQNELVVTTQRL